MIGFLVRRLQQDGHKGVVALDFLTEFHTGIFFLDAIARVAHIGDDPQQVAFIFFIKADGFFIRGGQHDLGPASHAKHHLVLVQSLGHEVFRLFKDDLVNIGEITGIEADGVLHEQDGLHADFPDVVVDVHFIFDQFDDGQQKVGIAKPAEDIIDNAFSGFIEFQGDFTGKGGQDHDWDRRVFQLDFFSKAEGIHFFGGKHDDDQVYFFLVKYFESFFLGGGKVKLRWVAKAEGNIFDKDLLIDTTVVFQHKGVVSAGDQQHVVNTAAHQFIERCVAEIIFWGAIGYAGEWHKEHVLVEANLIKRLPGTPSFVIRDGVPY